jgi:hypothetical protein
VTGLAALFEEFKANGLQKELSQFDIEQRGGVAWKVFYVVAPDGLCEIFLLTGCFQFSEITRARADSRFAADEVATFPAGNTRKSHNRVNQSARQFIPINALITPDSRAEKSPILHALQSVCNHQVGIRLPAGALGDSE